MLQRYKKNRTSASFLLTKCATFFVRRYEGTFSVPSEALVVLYAYGSLIISIDFCIKSTLLLKKYYSSLYNSEILCNFVPKRLLHNGKQWQRHTYYRRTRA